MVFPNFAFRYAELTDTIIGIQWVLRFGGVNLRHREYCVLLKLSVLAQILIWNSPVLHAILMLQNFKRFRIRNGNQNWKKKGRAIVTLPICRFYLPIMGKDRECHRELNALPLLMH